MDNLKLTREEQAIIESWRAYVIAERKKQDKLVTTRTQVILIALGVLYTLGLVWEIVIS